MRRQRRRRRRRRRARRPSACRTAPGSASPARGRGIGFRGLARLGHAPPRSPPARFGRALGRTRSSARHPEDPSRAPRRIPRGERPLARPRPRFCYVDAARATILEGPRARAADERGAANPLRAFDVRGATEIAAAATCPRLRKIWLGDTSGRIVAATLALSQVVATYAPHAERVLSLYHCAKRDLLVSVGGDRCLGVHDGVVSSGDDDKQTAETNARPRFRWLERSHDAAVTASAASEGLALVATRAGTRRFGVWAPAPRASRSGPPPGSRTAGPRATRAPVRPGAE